MSKLDDWTNKTARHVIEILTSGIMGIYFKLWVEYSVSPPPNSRLPRTPEYVWPYLDVWSLQT